MIERTDNTKYRELNVATHVIFKMKKELIKSVKNYLLYEILCEELANQLIHAAMSLTHSVTQVAGPIFWSVLFNSLPNNGLTKVLKVSLTV